MARTIQFIYALGGYLVGLVATAYFFGFIADIGVPKSIIDGDAIHPALAALTNAGLLALFALHHSLAARLSVKRRWPAQLPSFLQRSTYLYTAAAATAMVVIGWQPIPVLLWSIPAGWAATAMVVAYVLAWTLMFSATFHFGHLDFFGLGPAWRRLRQRAGEPAGSLSARWLYGLVRHPISLGWLLVPWLVVEFTAGHLIFALFTLTYVLAATPFEERDLEQVHGEDYRRYREKVPAFLPRPGGKSAPEASLPAEQIRQQS